MKPEEAILTIAALPSPPKIYNIIALTPFTLLSTLDPMPR
jgi:hypothetical protein